MNFFISSFALFATTALAQGVPGTGEKPCCACSPGVPEIVCTAIEDDAGCITNPAKCPFEPGEERYCCCCNPTRDAIVCNAIPKNEFDERCVCPLVECTNIPWEPEWSDSWIRDL